jgi:hypothetical protein
MSPPEKSKLFIIENSTSRQSLSLSSDGNTFVVGAPYNEVNGFSSGLARVYRY